MEGRWIYLGQAITGDAIDAALAKIIGDEIACPKCGSEDVTDCNDGECDRINGPIVNHCHGCGHTFPVKSATPSPVQSS